ncbi:MAG: hypothetical protein KC560_16475 [Myxococcales bacterium]|nr:hypothetical protein [Myxococcales bacterium]
MGSRIDIVLFAEDSASEQILRAFTDRVARDCGAAVDIKTVAACGGYSVMIEELRAYQTLAEKGQPGLPACDVLVVGRDGNCKGHSATRAELDREIKPKVFPRVVRACPDPHIERWLLNDPAAVSRAVGCAPEVPARKCERGRYKAALESVVARGGHPRTFGGSEFAYEIAREADLYSAGASDPSFRAFVDELKGILERAKSDR